MVSDRFTILIEELGQALQIKLKPDANDACMIKYPDGLEIRIDPDRLGEIIYITSDLGAIPQGRYRENVFREALKANGLSIARVGIFCYNPKKESLLLFEQIPIIDLNGIRLAEITQSFTQKARIWKEGITRGEIPSYRSTEMTFGRTGGSGLFGLR